jgi:8-amino-7-oxononanoate synthase
VFRHNDVGDLEARLREARAALGPDALLYVAVEAVYSMDGDVAPLGAICDAAGRHGAAVIVDEAHSTGVLGPGGRGLVAQEGLEAHPALLCSIHTFGKALGCHGAVLCGPAVLKEYCANYCAPFIYSTAAGFHALASMRVACEYQAQQEGRRHQLQALVRAFHAHLGGDALSSSRATAAVNPDGGGGGGDSGCALLLPSFTPIQAVLIPGNARCSRVAAALQASGLDVRPLRPPTVPAGKERLRVVLHWHNTEEEVARLAGRLKEELGAGGQRQQQQQHEQQQHEQQQQQQPPHPVPPKAAARAHQPAQQQAPVVAAAAAGVPASRL